MIFDLAMLLKSASQISVKIKSGVSYMYVLLRTNMKVFFNHWVNLSPQDGICAICLFFRGGF